MTKSPSTKKNPLLLTKRLAESSLLREMSLLRSKTEVIPEKMVSPVDMKITYKIDPVNTGSEKEAVFEATLNIRGLKNKKPILKVMLTYRVRYEIKEMDPPIAEEEVISFANLNVPYNVWPFWREHVQNLTVRMGLPPYTLPLFKPSAHVKHVQKLLKEVQTK